MLQMPAFLLAPIPASTSRNVLRSPCTPTNANASTARTVRCSVTPSAVYGVFGRERQWSVKQKLRKFVSYPSREKGFFCDVRNLAGVEEVDEAEVPAVRSQVYDDITVTVEKTGWRQRRISGQVLIHAPVEVVWGLLTQYERLADYIPNLVQSRLLEHPDGGIRMEQVGILSRKFGLKVRIVLDVFEDQDNSQIEFRKHESLEFRQFVGLWTFRDATGTEEAHGHTGPCTVLAYALDVKPIPLFPISLVERKLMKDLPRNLLAIRERAQELTMADA